jgi:hypothetical protein
MQTLGHRLLEICAALDDALGDSDISHIENDAELRVEYPVQWAAERLNCLIDQVADKGLFHKGVK